jgi:hypothetical protein
MNRIVKALLPAVVLLAAAAPVNGAPRQRTETAPYEAPNFAVLDTLWVQLGSAPEARPLAGEQTVSVSLTDDTGKPVSGVVHQGKYTLGEFCGATEQPLHLMNRKPVHVHVFLGDGCSGGSLPTKGTVTFTFAR